MLVLSGCRTVGIPQPTQTAGPVVTARHEWGLGVGEEIHFTNPQTDTTQSNHGTEGGEKAVSSSLNFCITILVACFKRQQESRRETASRIHIFNQDDCRRGQETTKEFSHNVVVGKPFLTRHKT